MKNRNQIILTDHALIRYMERVMGLDLDAVRKKILSEGREHLMLMARTGNIPVGDGNYAILRDYVVVTIRPISGYAPMVNRLKGRLNVP